MNSKTLTTKFSTVAVIAFAIGLALIQGKAFAEANEPESPAGITQPVVADQPNPVANPSTSDVQTFNLPGAGSGGEGDDDGEGDDRFGEDDDNYGED